MTIIKNKEILYNGKKTIVQKSNIHGLGVFTEILVKKGEIISFIKGNYFKKHIKNERDSLSHPCWIGVGKEMWINPTSLYKHINHSCEPNCGIKGRVTVVALRNINQGEEITIDYSITEIDKLWHMKCQCGSKNCRGLIRSIQFLPKKVYNKYIPYMPTLFMNIYEKSNYSK